MKRLTIEHIIENSKPHPMGMGGRQYSQKIGDYTLSIVGGRSGLYGDFNTDFEVAVIDDTNGIL